MHKPTQSFLMSKNLCQSLKYIAIVILGFSLFSFRIIEEESFNFNLENNYFPPVTTPCNTDLPVPVTSANYDDLSVSVNTSGLCLVGCGVQDEGNLIDANEANSASVSTLIGLGVTHTISVADNTVDEYFQSGSFAGFLIENSSVIQVDLLDALVVHTYLDGALQESYAGTALATVDSVLLSSGQYYVGFYTEIDYDEIRISISSLAGVLSTTNIYHAVTNAFCAGPDLVANTPSLLKKPDYPARIVYEHTGIDGAVSLGTVVSPLAAVDTDDTNYASIDIALGVLATGRFAIKDQITDYEAGTYVGFDIENATVLGLDLLDYVTINTYLDGVLQESKSGSSELVSVDSGLLFQSYERKQIGFLSALPFDEAQIVVSQTLSLDLGSTRIYGLVLETFASGDLLCNEATKLVNPEQPVIINNSNSGFDGLACVGCEISNPNNILNGNYSDFSLINVAAGVAGEGSISVKNVLDVYPAGSGAGFVVRDVNDLLQVDFLSSISVTTYLDGVEQESISASDLLIFEALGAIDFTPLEAEAYYLIGFNTTSPYNEIQLTVSALAGLLNSIEVYGAYVNDSLRINETITNETVEGNSDGSIALSVSGGVPPYEYSWSPNGETSDTISGLSPGTYYVTVTDSEGCQNTEEFIVYTDGVQYSVECNTVEPVAITSAGFTDLSYAENTTGVCVASCGVFSVDNLLDPDDEEFVSVTTLAGLGVTHTLSVTDDTPGEYFEGGGFAGFLIQNTSLLQVDLLNTMVIRTYLDGALQETNNGINLVTIDGALIGASQFYVGFYTEMDYDTIEISLSSLVGVLSTTRIYSAVTSSFCVGPELQPNTPTMLIKPEFPARIVDEHTGFEGVLPVGVINNENAAIDNNPYTYATVDFLLGVLATANFAIKDELTDYPGGNYAGFEIENESVLNLDLLDSFTINTYLDGVMQESKTGSNELLAAGSGLLFEDNERKRVGFVTTMPFDEVQLRMSQPVSLDLGSTRIYGAVVQTFAEGEIDCADETLLVNPEQPAIINSFNTGVDGLACVGCEVDDASNVINGSNSDFALINVAAGVANTASLSVQNVLGEFPAGSAAGFVIRDTNNILQADLLNTMTITTYLDEVEQESYSQSNLLLLDALGLVNITPTSPTGFYLLSFDTTMPYDEIKLSTSSLVSAVNSIEVYSAYLDATGVEECLEAGIALIKTAVFNDENTDGCTDVGETITYTFTLTNSGDESIASVVLADPMLSGNITFVSGDDDSDNELDPDETWVYTADYNVTQQDIDLGLVSNQATITGTSTLGVDVSDLSDNDSITEDDPTETTLCQSVGIALIKTAIFNDEDGDGCANAGETLSYTFTVTNEGNTSINTVVLDDPLLGGSIAIASGDDDADNELDSTEIWVYEADYTITQEDIDSGSVSNQATVTGISASGVDVSDLSDDDSITEDEPTETILCQSEGIALIKTAIFNDEDGDGCANAGETLSYTFTVTNEGNTSINTVVLNDPLLGGVIALASGDDDADNELDPTEIWIYQADYSITQDDIDLGSISNQATVTGTSASGVDVSDVSDDDSVTEDEATVTILCQTEGIALIKTAVFNDENGDNCSNLGETVSYTFNVTNLGNTSINTLVLNDPLLGGVIALTSGDDDADNELDPTEIWIYEANYIITQPDIDLGTITNQATVTGTSTSGIDVSDLSDDDSIAEDDSTITRICFDAEIALVKTASFNDENGDSCTDVGETLTYTLTVTNESNTTITDIVVNDPLLGGDLSLTSGDDDSDNELDATEIWIYVADYSITQSDIDIGLVSNQATVTGLNSVGIEVSDLSDDDNVTEDDATITNLCQSVGIALVKVGEFNDLDADNCSDIGETITYTFTVTNEGNTSISSVVLDDPMLSNDIPIVSGDDDNDDELDPDEVWIYTWDYLILQSDIDAGSVFNQAVVSGLDVDGNNVSDLSDDNSTSEDDITETKICNEAEISFEKIGVFNDDNGDGSPQVGETISYTFIVYNNGLETLSDIVISDPLPGITMINNYIASLAPGASDSSTITATYAITADDIANLQVVNQATISSFTPDGTEVIDLSDDPNILDNVDANGDGEPDDPTITILPLELDEEFEIFNAVSPDGDGYNEFFRIVGIENYPDNNLQVFNRWGILVYETEGYGRDGRLFKGVSQGRVTVQKNEELPTGTYFYVLKRYVDSETLTNQGYLYIKRN